MNILAEVDNRINSGTATGQDYLYTKEIAKRKKDPSKGEEISFVRGSGANAIKLKISVPAGFQKTKIRTPWTTCLFKWKNLDYTRPRWT